MKTKQVKNLGYAMLVLGLITFSRCAFAQQPCVPDTTNEHSLQLDSHVINAATAAKHKRDFETRFMYNNGAGDVAYALSPEVIPMKELIKLYCMVKPKVCAGQQCFTGLRITLGQKNNEIVYFYQPVWLERNGGSQKEPEFTAHNDNHQVYYHLLNGELKIADDTSAFNVYATNVRIRHRRANGPLEPMVNNNDGRWENDTKSILFSFQEIFLIYDKKRLAREAQTGVYTGDIQVNTGAANFKFSKYRRNWRIKHTLYISSEGTSKIIGSQSRGQEGGGNFAHLCPPSCTTVTFVNQR